MELPNTLQFLRRALYERIYPLMRHQFRHFLPDGRKLRVADGFVVKYDAEGGQKELWFRVVLQYCFEPLT